jgi:RimJ/RimL family protein N-acetyltransferase
MNESCPVCPGKRVDMALRALVEWLVPGSIESVYLTSMAWAELGSEVTVRPFGRLIANFENPGYRERNCVWDLRADAVPLAERYAEIGRHFAKRGLHCFNYSPALGQDLGPFEEFFAARGLSDAPSLALVHSGAAPARAPAEVRLVSAKDDPRLLEEVFELPGQRFPGEAVRRAALGVLHFSDYRSYVCLYRGEVAGRIGLLEVGSVGRVKSIFVGDDFRRLGVATAMLSLVVTEAKRLGCELVCSEVDADNSPSLGLHRTVGFEPVGTMHTFTATRKT